MPAVTSSRNGAQGPLLRKLQLARKLWGQLAGRYVIKNEDRANACCHLELFSFLGFPLHCKCTLLEDARWRN